MKRFMIYLKAVGDWEGEYEAENRADAIDIAFDDANSHGDPFWEIYSIEEITE